MSTMTEQRCHCGATIPAHVYACEGCATTLASDLREAADHLRWIDDKRARRGSRTFVGYRAPSAETPLPYDARVRRVLTPIRNTLTTWARLTIAEHKCRDLPSPRDTARVAALRAELDAWQRVIDQINTGLLDVNGDRRGLNAMRDTLAEDVDAAVLSCDLTNLADVALWLADHAEWISTRPWAMEAGNDASDAKISLDTLMDNPPETVALGTCDHDDCAHVLVAEVGATTSTCPKCGWTHDVVERRMTLLKQADDLTVTVKEATRLLRLAGHDTDARTVYALIRHFGIVAVLSVRLPGGKKPSSIYRLGALREAVERHAADSETRREVRLSRGAA